MTADVNVTEKVARALSALRGSEVIWQQDLRRATAALSALADPDVQAGIAGVLDEHDMGRLTSGRPYCWTHHTHDPLHLAAAVVERLTGERP